MVGWFGGTPIFGNLQVASGQWLAVASHVCCWWSDILFFSGEIELVVRRSSDHVQTHFLIDFDEIWDKKINHVGEQNPLFCGQNQIFRDTGESAGLYGGMATQKLSFFDWWWGASLGLYSGYTSWFSDIYGWPCGGFYYLTCWEWLKHHVFFFFLC